MMSKSSCHHFLNQTQLEFKTHACLKENSNAKLLIELKTPCDKIMQYYFNRFCCLANKNPARLSHLVLRLYFIRSAFSVQLCCLTFNHTIISSKILYVRFFFYFKIQYGSWRGRRASWHIFICKKKYLDLNWKCEFKWNALIYSEKNVLCSFVWQNDHK